MAPELLPLPLPLPLALLLLPCPLLLLLATVVAVLAWAPPLELLAATSLGSLESWPTLACTVSACP